MAIHEVLPKLIVIPLFSTSSFLTNIKRWQYPAWMCLVILLEVVVTPVPSLAQDCSEAAIQQHLKEMMQTTEWEKAVEFIQFRRHLIEQVLPFVKV
ncbi:MAG: hypothetical protein SFY66_01165 [Oculatellaceae cyanobacterium bins.114]|nr:hypothetical protein [Oculatellaceae cyanobacterium bins.114]